MLYAMWISSSLLSPFKLFVLVLFSSWQCPCCCLPALFSLFLYNFKLSLTSCWSESQEFLPLQLFYPAGNASCSCSEDHYPPWGQAKDRTDSNFVTWLPHCRRSRDATRSLFQTSRKYFKTYFCLANRITVGWPFVDWNLGSVHQTSFPSAGLATWLVEVHQTGFI